MSASEIYTAERLIDIIFVDLMKNGHNHESKQSGYIDQISDKFKFFIMKSPSVFFEINKNDLSGKTKKQIENLIQDCKTTKEKYIKLNGVMSKVIAQIAKQAEPMILSQIHDEDINWIKKSLYEIREIISFKWKLIGVERIE